MGMAPLLPWLLGFAALGIGVLFVGGNSLWLIAFVVPAILLGIAMIL